MNQRELASVLFAVLGIFIAATRLPELVLHAAMVIQSNPAIDEPGGPDTPRAVSLLAIVAILIVVFLGLALIVLRDRISGWLFSSARGRGLPPEIQAVALSVLGVYFILDSIPGIMLQGGVRWASVVQALLGTALFLGAHGIAAVWSRLRTPGPARYEGG